MNLDNEFKTYSLMKNNCLKHLFTALLLLYAMVVSAHDFEVDGIYYNILSEEEKTVEVTYGGDHYNSYSNEYTGSMVIPESVTYNGTTYSVTSIGDNAFSGCIWLRSITIPNSVTSIGEFAFSVCIRLTSVTIPNSVTSIGGYAFYSCTGLTSITIPDGVTSIGDEAFDECTGLKEVHISDLVAWCNIDFGRYSSNPMCCAHNLYLNGELVTELVIPEDVTKINSYAFYGCTGLTSVTIPNSVTSIGFEAFDGCTGLTSVTIPNSVTIIGKNAFNGCTELKVVHISDLVAWCNIYFAYYSGNPMCCAHNLYLNGELVTELVIPDDVTKINSYAFYGCTCIRSVVIGNGVASIGKEAFYGCSSLTSIVVDKENSVYDSRDNCNAIIETKTNTLIAGCKNTVIPNSVTSIGNHAFENCSSLTSIEIPNSVTSIENYAFYGCSSLTNITIPNSVTSIGGGAFEGCTGLTSITIPNSVTSIGSGAFRDCTGLTSITIPDGVTSIGDWTFENCSSLTNITIPNSVTSIGYKAFDGCTGLTSIYLLSIVPPSISSSSFSYTQYKNAVLYVPQGTLATYQVADYWKNFTNITELVDEDLEFTITSEEDATVAVTGYSGNKSTVAIPSHYTIDGKTYTVTSIGNQAFYDYAGLTSVEIPNSVTSIGHQVFFYCSSLTSIEIPNSVTSIGSYAFYGCTGLTSIEIPNSVTSIGSYAFSRCTGLTSVNFNAENCTSMGRSSSPVFSGCTALSTVTIGENVKNIPDYAFHGCTGLTSVISYIPTENLFTVDYFCDFEVYSACTLYVPKGAKEKYASTHQWDVFGDIVEINIPGITINRKTVILTEGETSTLVTIVIIDGVADEDIIWSTSNSAVATVESGLVTAIAPGSATITATVGGYSDSCVVTVAVPITSLSELNNNTVYHICQPHHSKGATSWAVERGGDKLRSNVDLGIELDSDDPRQQFAILSDDGGNTYFLYHVTESKFICKDGSLSETPVDAIKFMEGAYSDTFFAYFDNSHYVNVGGSQQMLIDRWSTPDGGNSCLIQHVGEFDPTEALEAIHNFTGIEDVKAESGEENGIYYDLNGRAVENPANGIYLIDGKKVLVK